MYFFVGRLHEQATFHKADIDLEIFFDNHQFLGKVPVVNPKSGLFFSYLMEVHMKLLPHSGVEFTEREILKVMFPIGKFRHILRRVRKDCTFCRKMFKKTCELQMSKQHFSRLMIAPAFYNVMIDIVYGFTASTYPKSRKTYKLYAIVFVCTLTAATNILALEAIETQHVFNAI